MIWICNLLCYDSALGLTVFLAGSRSPRELAYLSETLRSFAERNEPFRAFEVAFAIETVYNHFAVLYAIRLVLERSACYSPQSLLNL